MSPADVLDPTVEKLRALYGPGDFPGPFPDSRWLSAECRAVLHYRTELSYQEISERLGFLHQIEKHRRSAVQPVQQDQEKGMKGTVSQEVRAVAAALVRYVCDDVCPALRDAQDTKDTDHRKRPQENPRPSEGGFWQALDFVGMLSATAEAAIAAKPTKATKLSSDELTSILSKLQQCFWLAPLPRPDGWPLEAPWRGSECGLCSAEEVLSAPLGPSCLFLSLSLSLSLSFSLSLSLSLPLSLAQSCSSALCYFVCTCRAARCDWRQRSIWLAWWAHDGTPLKSDL